MASGTPWARGCGGEELAEARAGAAGVLGPLSALGGLLGPAGHLPPPCLEGSLLTHRIFCLDPRSECCWVKGQVRSHGSGVTPTHLLADPTGVSLGLFAGTQEVTLTQSTGSDLLPSWGTLQTRGGRGANPDGGSPRPLLAPAGQTVQLEAGPQAHRALAKLRCGFRAARARLGLGGLCRAKCPARALQGATQGAPPGSLPLELDPKPTTLLLSPSRHSPARA